jgi:hypothetical protein
MASHANPSTDDISILTSKLNGTGTTQCWQYATNIRATAATDASALTDRPSAIAESTIQITRTFRERSPRRTPRAPC